MSSRYTPEEQERMKAETLKDMERRSKVYVEISINGTIQIPAGTEAGTVFPIMGCWARSRISQTRTYVWGLDEETDFALGLYEYCKPHKVIIRDLLGGHINLSGTISDRFVNVITPQHARGILQDLPIVREAMGEEAADKAIDFFLGWSPNVKVKKGGGIRMLTGWITRDPEGNIGHPHREC